MKFSLMYSFVTEPGGTMSHRDTFREMDRLLPLAEELGYDSFHTTEHHFQDNGWAPSPLLVLAHAAGLTRRMRLATNIMIPTLCQPLRLAEDLLTLDNLSNGRLTMGTSPGYVSEEFAAYGVAYEDRFRLHEAIIDFIQHAWANPDDAGFDCPFFGIPKVKLVPRPVQARLPIWYGVSGPKLLARAARRGVPVTASPRHTIRELTEQFGRYEEAAAAAGYTPTERPVIREAFLADTDAEAERIAGPALSQIFALYVKKSAQGERVLLNDAGEPIDSEAAGDFRNFASRYMIGDPATVRRDVQELIDKLAPTEIILRMQLPGIPTPALEHSLRLFAEQVMPEFA
ncbi:LLM class flavin-dependent oxidoreductase [Marinibaculum pumilum]|uniref:LLM class flavin-dependent oxidoreductase n=1 Tax=Marinibaculum pumilum TaxID=1766165 RepID=A0ABV7KUF9_9PROT